MSRIFRVTPKVGSTPVLLHIRCTYRIDADLIAGNRRLVVAPRWLVWHAVHVVRDEAGEPWFVAPDVCKALGVENIPDALAFQDDEEKGFDSIETLVARRRWRSSSSPASTT